MVSTITILNFTTCIVSLVYKFTFDAFVAGYSYAKEFAKRGLNIVLLARSLEKLQNRQQEIIASYSVKVKIIRVDFSQSDVYDMLRSKLDELDIGVLVNNVGMTQNPAVKYLDTAHM